MTMETRSLLAISNFRINSAENEDALNIKFMAVEYLRDLESEDDKERTLAILKDIANYNISDVENTDAWVMKAYAVNTITQVHAETDDDDELPTRISTVKGKEVPLNEETAAMYAKVEKILIEHLGVEPDRINLKAHLVIDLGADSLDAAELVMAFEEEYNITIPDCRAENVETVSDILKVIKDCMADEDGYISAFPLDIKQMRKSKLINAEIKILVAETISEVTLLPNSKIHLKTELHEYTDEVLTKLHAELQKGLKLYFPRGSLVNELKTVKDLILYLSHFRPNYEV